MECHILNTLRMRERIRNDYIMRALGSRDQKSHLRCSESLKSYEKSACFSLAVTTSNWSHLLHISTVSVDHI